ncbi:MAG: hypothetical protein ACI9X0_002206, partial [Kiritimatiellia bacterium]
SPIEPARPTGLQSPLREVRRIEPGGLRRQQRLSDISIIIFSRPSHAFKEA